LQTSRGSRAATLSLSRFAELAIGFACFHLIDAGFEAPNP
jgi:hypothetical protein